MTRLLRYLWAGTASFSIGVFHFLAGSILLGAGLAALIYGLPLVVRLATLPYFWLLAPAALAAWIYHAGIPDRVEKRIGWKIQAEIRRGIEEDIRHEVEAEVRRALSERRR